MKYEEIRMENIMLSIYVATYNHERYLRQALDSIFAQQTNYFFEVIVGDDCSTDNTRMILEEYEREHPQYVDNGCLRVIYRDHNMYNETPNNFFDLVCKCKGKYVIALEGDDYWINKNKLQFQIDFLENNPQYVAVAHDCIVVDEDSKIRDEKYPGCNDEEYTLKHFMSNKFPGQTTTVMYRNIYNSNQIDISVFNKGLMPGDMLRNFVLLTVGKIRCFPDKMSAYRHITSSGDSWSAKYHYNFQTEYDLCIELVRYSNNIGNKQLILASESLLMRCLAKGLKHKLITVKELFLYLRSIRHHLYVFRKWIQYKLYKDILKKEFWY